jgi:hypothetical protein
MKFKMSNNFLQASLHVWKVIVSNTPKTLREILPTLFNLLLGCLASSSYDKRQVNKISIKITSAKMHDKNVTRKYFIVYVHNRVGNDVDTQ